MARPLPPRLTATAQIGSIWIRRGQQLLFGFLRHTGLPPRDASTRKRFRRSARAGRGSTHQRPAQQRATAFNRLQAGLRVLVEQAIGHLAGAWALRRWRG
jgi:hypothetical protein